MKDDEIGWARSTYIPINLSFYLLFSSSFLLLFPSIKGFSLRRINCQRFIGMRRQTGYEITADELTPLYWQVH
jgi:hypothetical protein